MYTVRIDEEQVYKFIKPIFDSLVKNNADLSLIKSVFIDLKNSSYFEFLPENLKQDWDFVKECLGSGVLGLSEIDKSFRDKNIISRELYMSIIKNNPLDIKWEIYEQDEEIVLTALINNEHSYYYIKDKFKNNQELMLKCVNENFKILNLLLPECKDELLKNDGSWEDLLKKEPKAFKFLKENEKVKTGFLKAALSHPDGYGVVFNYLSKNKDKDIALMALEKGDHARKFIHPIYAMVLNKNKIKKNCFDFLDAYLKNKELREKIKDVDEKEVNKLSKKI